MVRSHGSNALPCARSRPKSIIPAVYRVCGFRHAVDRLLAFPLCQRVSDVPCGSGLEACKARLSAMGHGGPDDGDHGICRLCGIPSCEHDTMSGQIQNPERERRKICLTKREREALLFDLANVQTWMSAQMEVDAAAVSARANDLYVHLVSRPTAALCVRLDEIDRTLMVWLIEHSAWVRSHAAASHQKQSAAFTTLQRIATKVEQAFALKRWLRVPVDNCVLSIKSIPRRSPRLPKGSVSPATRCDGAEGTCTEFRFSWGLQVFQEPEGICFQCETKDPGAIHSLTLRSLHA